MLLNIFAIEASNIAERLLYVLAWWCKVWRSALEVSYRVSESTFKGSTYWIFGKWKCGGNNRHYCQQNISVVT